jgi:hypothetical protein
LAQREVGDFPLDGGQAVGVLDGGVLVEVVQAGREQRDAVRSE